MQKLLRGIAVTPLIFCIVIALSSYAYAGTAIRKLGRGAANIISAPLEFPNQMKDTLESDGKMAMVTVGFVKGAVMTATRAVVGVYEVATFPLPFPKDYRPILRYPEFFFEPEQY